MVRARVKILKLLQLLFLSLTLPVFALHRGLSDVFLGLWHVDALHCLLVSTDLLLVDLLNVRSNENQHNPKDKQVLDDPAESREIALRCLLLLLISKPASHVVNSVSLAPDADHLVDSQNVRVALAVVVQNRKRVLVFLWLQLQLRRLGVLSICDELA